MMLILKEVCARPQRIKGVTEPEVERLGLWRGDLVSRCHGHLEGDMDPAAVVGLVAKIMHEDFGLKDCKCCCCCLLICCVVNFLAFVTLR